MATCYGGFSSDVPVSCFFPGKVSSSLSSLVRSKKSRVEKRYLPQSYPGAPIGLILVQVPDKDAEDVEDLTASNLSSSWNPSSIYVPSLNHPVFSKFNLQDPPFSDVESSGQEGGLKGTFLDVVPFLSNRGKTPFLLRPDGQLVPHKALFGKYLLICCLSLPVLSGTFASDLLYSLIATHHELPRHCFEIVFVALTKPLLVSSKDQVFHTFFSASPCLAVPPSHTATCEAICSFVGLGQRPDRDPATLLVHPSGVVLHHRSARHYFRHYGSEWFPFLDSNVKDLVAHDDVLRVRLDPFYDKQKKLSPDAAPAVAAAKEDPRPLSLHQDILLCDPSLVLSRVDPSSGRSMTVSDLSNKHLGLYLCLDGEFMPKLHQVHEHCLANQLELEILVVCLPLFEDPTTYQEDLYRALKLCNINSWFIFPFHGNSQVCRRLWRVFGQKSNKDKLIILPPTGSSNSITGEMEGRAVIDEMGVKEYPFTRSTIFARRFHALKSLTPDSWFTCLGRKGSNSVSWSAGKKLLLYLDWLEFFDDNGNLCRVLMKHYSEILHIGCEVVFVPLDGPRFERDPREVDVGIPPMPWPSMPLEAALEAMVTEQLILPGEHYRQRIIAFGEDGKILSREAQKELMENGVTDSLFRDSLYQELIHDLAFMDTDNLQIHLKAY